MKAGKMAIWPWLSCPYNENTLVDPSVSRGIELFFGFFRKIAEFSVLAKTTQSV
jgi:hypothetical protein